MQLLPSTVTNLKSGAQRQPNTWLASHGNHPIHAVAGIGNPQRFFASLKALGFVIIPHEFPDHHQFQPEDLEFADTLPVFMTAKDAVKCRSFAKPTWWSLEITAQLSPDLLPLIDEKLVLKL